MAVIKHGSSKNANYGAAELYLEYEHDEDTQRPILDEHGHYIPRQEYIISGIHCTPDTYAMECIKANLRYGQNQNKGDVKSHHYIISFDPRDRDDHNLTLEEVHQMGEQFCRENFAGHQALICAHADGHHKAGNLHVHIVINSVRIENVERKDYMDRPCDTKAGAKHRCTGKLMRHLREKVMEMCQERGLYQIDLLSGAEKRVSDKEYHVQQNGQKKLDAENAKLIAEGKQPKETIFDTQKEELRQVIDATLPKCSSLDDFVQKLFQDYGVEVTESRGRFSYLHPNSKRKVADRRLGERYRKGNIENGISQQNNGRDLPNRGTESDLTFCLNSADLNAAAEQLNRSERAGSELADHRTHEQAGAGKQRPQEISHRASAGDERTGGEAKSVLQEGQRDAGQSGSIVERIRSANRTLREQQRAAQRQPQFKRKRRNEPSL